VVSFLIYRQSDKSGFRRWWTSKKELFSAIAASWFNPQAIEPPGNNNQVYQERLLDQEFNSFEDNDQKKLFWLKQAIVHLRFRHLEEGSRVNFLPQSGGRPVEMCRSVNPYRTAPKVVPGEWVQLILIQVMVVELLNSMISVLFKKEQSQESNTPNHGSTSKVKKKNSRSWTS
jgi:hypothetical protein